MTGTDPAALEDLVVNALRRVFAERDRHDAIREMRDYGDQRVRLTQDILHREAGIADQRDRLALARQAGDKLAMRKAENAIRAWTERLRAPQQWHEKYTRDVIRAYQERFLRDAEAPLTPISPDLPADVAELVQACLGNPAQNPAANPPTRESDPATG